MGLSMSENKKVDDETFQALLYVSRIEITEKSILSLQSQITNIISYFHELEKFKDEDIDISSSCSNSENDLRVVSDTQYIEQNFLKSMTEEFMDGYFRSPKVLGSS